MNTSKIVADSTVRLPKEKQENHTIMIVPLAVLLDHTLYYNGIFSLTKSILFTVVESFLLKTKNLSRDRFF